MGAAQRLAHVLDDPSRGRQRQPPLAREPGREVLALEQLHHDVRRAVLDPVVVDLHRVRALEHGRGLGLAFEAGPQIGGAGELGGHELDGDVHVELEVAGDPDAAHAALRQYTLEAITSGDELACLVLGHAANVPLERLRSTHDGRPRVCRPHHAVCRRTLGRGAARCTDHSAGGPVGAQYPLQCSSSLSKA